MDEDFTDTVLTERAIAGNGYVGAYQAVKDWHADQRHVGKFEHCTIWPCYDVVRGGHVYPG